MASVTYDHVTKRYSNDSIAVKDLSLDVRDTEFMVLVGPSGCGKSTALRMLAGLEDITEGNIRIGTRVVNDVPARERDIAMVFQSYALYPHMSVQDNMAFGLKMRGISHAEMQAKVAQAARMLGLQDLLQRKPGQLSGGERQRVALGRAIVRNPQVFLLDEPLSNLDAQLRVETRINLQKLHKDLGTTFIYVTHDQLEAMTMGDRIAVLRLGVLQQVARPRMLYDHPANMYVAGFFGSPRMNFISARVDYDEATTSGFTVRMPRTAQISAGVIGIRPEDLSDDLVEGRPQVQMRVEVVEAMGSDQYLHGKLGDDDVIARIDSQRDVAHGDLITLAFDRHRMHLFDPKTEMALL